MFTCREKKTLRLLQIRVVYVCFMLCFVAFLISFFGFLILIFACDVYWVGGLCVLSVIPIVLTVYGEVCV